MLEYNWNNQIALTVKAHLENFLRSEQTNPNEEHQIARQINALPVYADFSGILGVGPEGTILRYDWESGEFGPITDNGWPIIAAVSAAEKYPDLLAMLPDKPPGAKPCSPCEGTGKQFHIKVFCGTCLGLGWVS